ncbi:FGGY-family carbohydrate kinase [Nocardioides panaciterrulae]|uniref:Sugar (Pentulose or hexulose) kinase n=1 Tax=Nocardioides panaciterrulae TaxID=661492 RepID=A0A7Y9E692_9ACTN|nr:sugar (pentulose or hexulose) kinase [Nocardioides panaciterrulae]
MTRFIIGIDGGTQSSKVAVFDTHGRIVCEASQPLRPLSMPEPGVVEHPDDDLYDSVVAAASQAMAAFPGDPADIVGVGLCSIRCCRALVRDDLTLAAPVQSWMDERLSRPYEHVDDDVAHVTTASGYLMGRLTGQRVDTAANYIGPWPMDVRTWEWFTDQEVFDSFNVPREMLYRLQLPGDIGGALTEEFAAATGIPPGIPVVHTANDKAADALGSGLRDERTGLVSLGTYIAGMIQGHEFVAEPASYFTNFGSEPDTYVYESAGIRRGMWTVSWLRDLLGAEVAPGDDSDDASSEDRLNEAAARIPAGSDGLLCLLDWLAPPTMPYRKGVFIGLDERHGYGHLYRAILEGIAFTMHRNMMALQDERQVTLDTLVVSGGGSYSDVCMQIFADVFGLTTVRNEVRDSAGLGAAICVAVACGIYPDFDTASREMVHAQDLFSPHPAHRDLYTQLSAIHGDISSHIDPILMRVHQALAENQGVTHG